jgi:hypothetical protein
MVNAASYIVLPNEVPSMDGLQYDDRATVLRLITTTIHQHVKADPRDLAVHIAAD